MTPVLNARVEGLSAALQRGKKGYDEEFARKFTVTALLYFFHDMQKEKWPNILADTLWQAD